jgi:polysaccharide biosynthesis protein PslH
MNVLVVSPHFPFPPRGGVNMRVYQLLRQIAAKHTVTLLSYARPAERAHVAALAKEIAVETVVRASASRSARRGMQLWSMAAGQPFAVREVFSPAMQRALYDQCARGVDIVQFEASVLCGLDVPAGVSVVLDEHNVEYEVLQRMSRGETSLVRRAFNRFEYRRFRPFEERGWRRADGCAVTSEREEPIVRAAAPRTPTAIVPNGVDLEYFSPADGRVKPRTVVFNGTLMYRPNVDAAYHLVEEIWPRVLERCPDAVLTIVGHASAADRRRLARAGVVLTGEVEDIRPYLQRAAVVAVPVRIGGGTRLKVVEALAMGKAVVSTSLGCEGIAVRDREHLLVADGGDVFASRVVNLFADEPLRDELGRAGRALTETQYSWQIAGARLESLYRQVVRMKGRE